MGKRGRYLKCVKCGGTIKMGRTRKKVKIKIDGDMVSNWLCGGRLNRGDWLSLHGG